MLALTQAGRDGVLCGGAPGRKVFFGPGYYQDPVHALPRVPERQERRAPDAHARYVHQHCFFQRNCFADACQDYAWRYECPCLPCAA